MKRRFLIPRMLRGLVRSALADMDGVVFDSPVKCRYCGGGVAGYDIRKRAFACIIEDGKKREIHVHVKRFYCSDCGKVCYADAPFYPGTRIGSPVVDLCVCLAATMPFNRAERYLEEIGLAVDRGTIRNYAHRNFGSIPYVEIFGIHMPISILNISVLSITRGEEGPVTGAEPLTARRFPPA